MPVHGSNFRGRAARQAVRWPESDVQQSEYAAEEMQPVRGSEDVEKAAGRIRRQKKPRRCKLPPGDYLADQKENSEDGGDAPPVAETGLVMLQEAATRVRQRKTAGDKDSGVQPEDGGDAEINPGAVGHALADNVGADERHEEHQDAAEAHGHASYVSALRHAAGTGGGVPLLTAPTAIAAAGRISTVAFSGAGTDQLDFICDCAAWHCFTPRAKASDLNLLHQPLRRLLQSRSFLGRQILRDEVLLISRNAEFV